MSSPTKIARKVGSNYKYVGYYIQNWSTGTKAAMYRFKADDKDSGAPVYIEFNDHMIESAAAEHFHIRMSNESFDAIGDPENSWPTFFPADMTGEEICEHMEGHDHDDDEDHEHEEEKDEHVWLSLKNAEVLVNAISNSLQELDPDNKDTYATKPLPISKSSLRWTANIRLPWTLRPIRPFCSATVSRSAIWWTITV